MKFLQKVSHDLILAVRAVLLAAGARAIKIRRDCEVPAAAWTVQFSQDLILAVSAVLLAAGARLQAALHLEQHVGLCLDAIRVWV